LTPPSSGGEEGAGGEESIKPKVTTPRQKAAAKKMVKVEAEPEEVKEESTPARKGKRAVRATRKEVDSQDIKMEASSPVAEAPPAKKVCLRKRSGPDLLMTRCSSPHLATTPRYARLPPPCDFSHLHSDQFRDISSLQPRKSRQKNESSIGGKQDLGTTSVRKGRGGGRSRKASLGSSRLSDAPE
jgi:hypothetical protein